uniref:low-density lipoprotein receptor-related protein 6-like n=1 Tax=Styela clava TaxID=7725 RepID=UPI00193AB5DF|nr:low-density lipoprotein receptor-related protein 6-like [Styela clava]
MNASETCEGLAIDWVARNLYWVEYTNKIKVSRMNGSLQKTLVGADDLDTPRGIAVDPLRGKLYWGEWGFKPRIASAWMDGTNSKTLVDEDIMWPNGITLDIERNVIYWIDARFNTISVVNTDGSGRKQLLSTSSLSQRSLLFGINYVDNHIYWTDWLKRNLESFNVNTNETKTLLHTNIPINGVKATKLYPPPGITNQCGVFNGGCWHLCLYTPKGPSCNCADGWKLDEHGACTETDIVV